MYDPYASFKLSEPFVTFMLDCFETNKEWCETNLHDIMIETYTLRGVPVLRKEFLDNFDTPEEAINRGNNEIQFHSHLNRFIELCERWLVADRFNNKNSLEIPQTLAEFYSSVVPPIDNDPEGIGDTWCASFAEFQEFCVDRVEENDERYTQQYVDWIEYVIRGRGEEEEA